MDKHAVCLYHSAKSSHTLSQVRSRPYNIIDRNSTPKTLLGEEITFLPKKHLAVTRGDVAIAAVVKCIRDKHQYSCIQMSKEADKQINQL